MTQEHIPEEAQRAGRVAARALLRALIRTAIRTQELPDPPHPPTSDDFAREVIGAAMPALRKALAQEILERLPERSGGQLHGLYWAEKASRIVTQGDTRQGPLERATRALSEVGQVDDRSRARAVLESIDVTELAEVIRDSQQEGYALNPTLAMAITIKDHLLREE